MRPVVCAGISSATANENNKILTKLYYSKNVSNITNLNKSKNNTIVINNKCPNKSEQQIREIETRRIWQKADAVCFDVDSTVCQVKTYT